MTDLLLNEEYLKKYGQLLLKQLENPNWMEPKSVYNRGDIVSADHAMDAGLDFKHLVRIQKDMEFYLYDPPKNIHLADFKWSEEPTVIGVHPDFVIIDDPLNHQEIAMSKVETKRGKPVAYNTVGIRFLDGNNLAKVYTYRVPKKARLHLGQEVVVPTDKQGTGYITRSVGVVVELHDKPQDTSGYDYKFVTGVIKPL